MASCDDVRNHHADDDIAFIENPDWARGTLEMLHELRVSGDLCNMTLCSSDGQCYRAHCCVLAAASPSMKAILTQQATDSYVLQLDAISGDIIDRVLQFIYTGRTYVALGTLSDMISACDQLGIAQLNDLCVRMLGENETDQKTVRHTEVVNCRESYDETDVEYVLANGRPENVTAVAIAECHASEVGGANGLVKQEQEIVNAIEIAAKDPHPEGAAVYEQLPTVNTSEVFYDEVLITENNSTDVVSQESCHAPEEAVTTSHTLEVDGLTGDLDAKSSGDKRLTCPLCEKTFTSSACLLEHVRVHGDRMLYMCGVCHKTFSWKHSLELHSRTHSGVKPYECKTCGKQFSHSSNYVAHNRTHSQDKAFQCPKCGVRFRGQSAMIRHRQKHSGLKKHECAYCEKRFHERYSLVVHERTHTGEKPYECSVCKEKFAQLSNLEYHQWTHVADRPFKCEQCERGFCSTNQLKQHIRIHTGEKPHECLVCHRKFRTRSDLVSHHVTHTGRRPYSCVRCGTTFTKRSNLTRHEQIHKKPVLEIEYSFAERPFQCSVCGRRFARKNDMLRHEELHTKSTSLVCHLCTRTFSRQSNLNRHIRSSHCQTRNDDTVVESTDCHAQSTTPVVC